MKKSKLFLILEIIGVIIYAILAPFIIWDILSQKKYFYFHYGHQFLSIVEVTKSSLEVALLSLLLFTSYYFFLISRKFKKDEGYKLTRALKIIMPLSNFLCSLVIGLLSLSIFLSLEGFFEVSKNFLIHSFFFSFVFQMIGIIILHKIFEEKA